MWQSIGNGVGDGGRGEGGVSALTRPFGVTRSLGGGGGDAFKPGGSGRGRGWPCARAHSQAQGGGARPRNPSSEPLSLADGLQERHEAGHDPSDRGWWVPGRGWGPRLQQGGRARMCTDAGRGRVKWSVRSLSGGWRPRTSS